MPDALTVEVRATVASTTSGARRDGAGEVQPGGLAAFAWQAEAACRSEHPLLVDPDEGDVDQQTLRLAVNLLCGRCPVQADCLAAGQHPRRHLTAVPPPKPAPPPRRYRPRTVLLPDWSTPALRAAHSAFARCQAQGWPVPTHVEAGEREYHRRRGAYRRATGRAS